MAAAAAHKQEIHQKLVAVEAAGVKRLQEKRGELIETLVN